MSLQMPAHLYLQELRLAPGKQKAGPVEPNQGGELRETVESDEQAH